MKQLLTVYDMVQLVDEMLKGYKYKLDPFDLRSGIQHIVSELEEAVYDYAKQQNELKPENQRPFQKE